MIRTQHLDDYEAIRRVYAEAFRRPRFRPPQGSGCVPPEVGLFEALWNAGDAIAELSFTALDDAGVVVGHVTASNATVATDAVVAVGPIGVVPDHQGAGIGSALMNALLSAADAADVPLTVLLGAPHYYCRFGFVRPKSWASYLRSRNGEMPSRPDGRARAQNLPQERFSTRRPSRPEHPCKRAREGSQVRARLQGDAGGNA
jgi:putative acetyltransferase